jgi:hypothetical protein
MDDGPMTKAIILEIIAYTSQRGRRNFLLPPHTRILSYSSQRAEISLSGLLKEAFSSARSGKSSVGLPTTE